MKTYGWVLQIKKSKEYSNRRFANILDARYITKLREATVFNTREQARDSKLSRETVCKVSLTKKGTAKKLV